MRDRAQRFNAALALRITSLVGTMWCAYLFAGIALVSLPAVLSTGSATVIVAWVAQTFLQLVLLAVIMVAQDVQARGVAEKINETHTASLAEFELATAARAEAATVLADLQALMTAVHATVVEP